MVDLPKMRRAADIHKKASFETGEQIDAADSLILADGRHGIQDHNA